MTDRYILDERGEPVPCPDLLTWGRWLETTDRIVAQKRFCDHPFPPTDDQIGRFTSPLWRTVDLERAVAQLDLSILVSTVFLGLDHAFRMAGDEATPPVLWESMIFGGPLSGEMRRYTSRADAIAGHAELCESVRLAIAVASGAPK